MKPAIFRGAMVAIVTPFRDGLVDEDCLRRLIDWQLSCGIDGIVPCGTTGESATLTPEERDRVIRIAVEQAAGRAPILAGAGSNSTEVAIRLTRQAVSAGADGTLQVTPYYNKPTQDGLYQHFRAIAAASDIPMILYNVPGRTSVNMTHDTTLKLASIDNVVGIKEASGDLEQIGRIISGAPDNFCVFSGDDSLNLKIYRIGGRGCISVTANIAPDRVSALWDAHLAGNPSEAEHIDQGLAELNKAMFLETNPIPVKTALALMGKIHEEFRLPLTPIGNGHRQELLDILKKYDMVGRVINY